jgi:hypothetical protein
MGLIQPLKTIYLYDEPNAAGLDIDQIGGLLASEFRWAEVLARSDFITHHLRRFSTPERRTLEKELLRQLETARDLDRSRLCRADGTFYPGDDEEELIFDSAYLQSVFRLLVPEEESSAEHLHIVFTEHLLATRHEEEGDIRLHIVALGEPSLISTSGLVEALPRPKEYNFRRAQIAMFGLGPEALEDLAEDFADVTFGYGDPRINEVCKGYALMACFYRAFGEAFCENPQCRLFAARTQEQLIAVQCGTHAGLCAYHRQLLESLRPQE